MTAPPTFAEWWELYAHVSGESFYTGPREVLASTAYAAGAAAGSTAGSAPLVEALRRAPCFCMGRSDETLLAPCTIRAPGVCWRCETLAEAEGEG